MLLNGTVMFKILLAHSNYCILEILIVLNIDFETKISITKY